MLGYFFPHLLLIVACVECCLFVEWDGLPVSENESECVCVHVCVRCPWAVYSLKKSVVCNWVGEFYTTVLNIIQLE